jgi:pyruvate dehydrogenase E2 component (dihydrolipoamide acetyltransferase)
MSKIQKLTAANMQRNWLNVPHVTHFDDADITDLEAFRKSLKDEGDKRGVKVTPVAFLIKAIATAMQAHPEFNRSLSADGESFMQKHYCNIGMAVDTPRGLVVPVIKDANEKGYLGYFR